jgi:hypothetical protein
MPPSGLVTPGRQKTIQTSCVNTTAPEIAGIGQKPVAIALLLLTGLSVAAAAAKCFVAEEPRFVRKNEFLVNTGDIFSEYGPTVIGWSAASGALSSRSWLTGA